MLNTHLIAEMYSNLTRFPAMKVTPDRARKMMYSFAREFEHVELTVEDYLKAVDRCADRNLISGVIFDALHFEAALKANVEVLYTANPKDFERFMEQDTPFRLSAPY